MIKASAVIEKITTVDSKEGVTCSWVVWAPDRCRGAAAVALAG